MRHAPHLLLAIGMAVTQTGCPSGDAEVGETCDRHADCESGLQCVAGTCAPRCQRAPECGDGYACTDGICELALGQPGDACTSEIQCAPGLSCQLDGTTVDGNGNLLASCAEQNAGRPPGSTCTTDDECRNGTCALGHCVDLCSETRDCAAGNSCMTIPRVEAGGTPFVGCLPSHGNVTWSIPVREPSAELLLPVPSGAQSALLVTSVDDLTQKVGAEELHSPAGSLLYTRPCEPPGTVDMPCTVEQATAQYFGNRVRHIPDFGQSVLAIPTSPMQLDAGAYRVRVSSFRPNGSVGSAIPSVTAVVRIDAAVILDLHLHFLDLDAHPCEQQIGARRLNSAVASTQQQFQNDYMGTLRSIFARGGIALGTVTYDDVDHHPDLDGLDIADVGSLFSLGSYREGINVFFVRTLSPVGLQAFGPSPGPAGLANTRQSGIVVGVDTLCYRSHAELARLTAHEIARYMGLSHNVELDARWRDAIPDSDDSPNNLMFFSEVGGTELSPGQRDILTRSPVLR